MTTLQSGIHEAFLWALRDASVWCTRLQAGGIVVIYSGHDGIRGPRRPPPARQITIRTDFAPIPGLPEVVDGRLSVFR